MELPAQLRLAFYLLFIPGAIAFVCIGGSNWLHRRARLERWRREQESRPPPVTQRPAAIVPVSSGVTPSLGLERERRPTSTPAHPPLTPRPSLPSTPLQSASLHRVRSRTTPRPLIPATTPIARPASPANVTPRMDTSNSLIESRPSSLLDARNAEAAQDASVPASQVLAQDPPRGTKRSASMSTEAGDLTQPLLQRRKLISGEAVDDEFMLDAAAAEPDADSSSSDESMLDPADVAAQPSHRGLAVAPTRERPSSKKGKAKSSAARQQQISNDLRVAAAKLKRRARLPGDGARKNLHRVEEEVLPNLPPGDTAEDLEGVTWRMGDDGRLRRLELLRTTRKKYDMPRGSTHPDADVTEVVYAEHWLTIEEFDRAKGDLLLLSQKADFEAEEAKRLEAEAIAIQKREDRQRRKIEKQTEEARLALERRRDVDRHLWGHLLNQRDTSRDSEEDMSVVTGTHRTGSVVSTSPGHSRRARTSEFGPSPNMSFNGSFRPRKRNEQRFNMETHVGTPSTSAPQPSTPAAPAPVAPATITATDAATQQPASSTPFSFGKKPEAQGTTNSAETKPAEPPQPSLFGTTSGVKHSEQPEATFSLGATAKPDSQPEAKPAEPPKTGFSFGTPAAGGKPAEAPKAGFSFGATTAETKFAGTPQPSFTLGSSATGVKPDEASKPSFSFGSTSAAKPADASAPKAPESKPFSFGTPAASSGGANPAPAKPSFSFGAPAATSASPAAAPASAPVFSFGAPSGSAAPASNPASTSAAPTFQFGAPSGTAAPAVKSEGFKFTAPSFNAGTK